VPQVRTILEHYYSAIRMEPRRKPGRGRSRQDGTAKDDQSYLPPWARSEDQWPAKSQSGLDKDVRMLFRNGEVEKAIEKAESKNSRQQAEALRAFEIAYNLWTYLSTKPGEEDRALGILERAYSMDQKISGGSGIYHDEMTTRLGNIYLRKGVNALDTKDYPVAYRAFRRALRYRPGWEPAKKNLRELEGIAKRLYEEAYVIKGGYPDRAEKNLDIVLEILPADNLYYSRSKKLLRRIWKTRGKI
jgi:tetratricopeptide (TPR) repeat protein